MVVSGLYAKLLTTVGVMVPFDVDNLDVKVVTIVVVKVGVKVAIAAFRI